MRQRPIENKKEEESCGNGGALESVESQRQASPSFHEPLGNLAKRRRDFHISTAPASVASLRAKSKQRIEKCGRWKSGNPKAGFPLSHHPDSLRQQGERHPMEERRGAS
jgi:hypothetical protein